MVFYIGTLLKETSHFLHKRGTLQKIELPYKKKNTIL